MQPRNIDVQKLLDDQPVSVFQWMILVLCFLVVGIDGLDTAAIGFIAPSLVTEWGATKASLAPVMGAALFGLAIGALATGPLADKHGRKIVIIASVLIFGVATLCSASSSSLTSLAYLRFVAGLGLGAAMPNTVTLISEYVPRRKRAFLSTLMFCGFSLGSAVSGLIASHIIPAFGWRSLLIVGGVLPLLLVVLLGFLLPESVRFLACQNASATRIAGILHRISKTTNFEDASFTISEVADAQIDSPVKALFQHNNLIGTILLWATYFMGLVVVYMTTGWLPTLMKEAGVPISQGAIVTGMFMLGTTFGAILMGWLMDYINCHVVLTVSYAGAAACMVAIGLHPGEVMTLRILVFVAGFAMGAQVSMVIVASQFYQTQCRATGVSWMLGIGRFGGIFGASMGGLLMSLGWGFQEIFFSLAIPATLAAVTVGLMGLYYSSRPSTMPAGAPEFDLH